MMNDAGSMMNDAAWLVNAEGSRDSEGIAVATGGTGAVYRAGW